MNKSAIYKVLRSDGNSAHGGDFRWSIPTPRADGTWQAGDWHAVEGPLELCRVGFHLTWYPGPWLRPGATSVWLAEGEEFGDHSASESKVVCRRARLMRPATPHELYTAHILIDGEAAPSTPLALAALGLQVCSFLVGLVWISLCDLSGARSWAC